VRYAQGLTAHSVGLFDRSLRNFRLSSMVIFNVARGCTCTTASVRSQLRPSANSHSITSSHSAEKTTCGTAAATVDLNTYVNLSRIHRVTGPHCADQCRVWLFRQEMLKGGEDRALPRDLLMLALSVFDIADLLLLLRLTDYVLESLATASAVEHVVEVVHDDFPLFRHTIERRFHYKKRAV
jgi:hypothetical protein